MSKIFIVLVVLLSTASCSSESKQVEELSRKYVKLINDPTFQENNERRFTFLPRTYNLLRTDGNTYNVEVPGIVTITGFSDTMVTTMSIDVKKFEQEWRITNGTMAYREGNTIEKIPVALFGSIGLSDIEAILLTKENNEQGSNVETVEQSDTSIRIVLPRNFVCTPESTPISQLFSDGRYTFSIYPWGHDGVGENDLVRTVEQNYENQIKFKKTATGLFWGTGKVEDTYYYIILIPEKLYQIQVFSKYNDEKFSYYSTWLYNQVSKAKDKEFYLVDHNRRSCSSN